MRRQTVKLARAGALLSLSLCSGCLRPAVSPEGATTTAAAADTLAEAVAAQAVDPAAPVPQDEDFDPFLLPLEELVFVPRDFDTAAAAEELAADPAGAEDLNLPEALEEEAPTMPLREGFQVQLITTTSSEQAEELRAQALYLFAGEPVNVVWDPPNYKVRVGNVPRREEAEELKRRAMRLGYREAWIVRAKVR